ncbi:MAG TPA: peptidoglycan DD-metalloendopeptidase family protein [Anaeromyxobacteraceae bacterium]|nr:peptidoglycan DD-metalloendopeptidase family protein [Anaeromyxobacteraceae bacterium]
MIQRGATPPGTPPADPRLSQAAHAMESMLLKQIITASKAFGGGESAGSVVRADMFAQTLADALAGSGGIGLADLLVRSLAGSPASAQASGPAPQLALGTGEASASGGGAPPSPAAALALSAPVAGAPTSSPFGLRSDPFSGRPAQHSGLDLAAPEGTPVGASAPGVVVSAGPRAGYGLAVEIDHGGGVSTLYGHASELLVEPGQRVERGQAIARVGETGRATGPHLHFEVRTQGIPVDPQRALSAYRNRTDTFVDSGVLTAARTP